MQTQHLAPCCLLSDNPAYVLQGAKKLLSDAYQAASL